MGISLVGPEKPLLPLDLPQTPFLPGNNKEDFLDSFPDHQPLEGNLTQIPCSTNIPTQPKVNEALGEEHPREIIPIGSMWGRVKIFTFR